ncbi:MAG: glycosyltransferase family protein, partial [Candidatus Adiutrix sp.]
GLDKNFSPLNILPPLDYYRELSPFYQNTAINLNITSRQMKTGLNQRIFDVPASGAFLLTDYRQQIENVFELGREIITYKSPEEALDLARFYTHNPHERQKIAQAALTRVKNCHLYRFRLAEIIAKITRD